MYNCICIDSNKIQASFAFLSWCWDTLMFSSLSSWGVFALGLGVCLPGRGCVCPEGVLTLCYCVQVPSLRVPGDWAVWSLYGSWRLLQGGRERGETPHVPRARDHRAAWWRWYGNNEQPTGKHNTITSLIIFKCCCLQKLLMSLPPLLFISNYL